ncbi:MAG: DUF4468 domain-containing protein [Saprospiraceae bacterium]|nr:DUF4468 domain-containing protein [Lewinellaceae bacterium]
MKTLIIIAFTSCCCTFSLSQELELDSTTNKLMYRGVIKIDSASVGDLFERGRQWIATAYRSANNVVQYENKEEGKIIGKGVWATWEGLGYLMEHTIILEFKNGRVRYTFTDFIKRYVGSTALAGSRQALESIKLMKKNERGSFAKEAARTAENLVQSIFSTSSKKDDDW